MIPFPARLTRGQRSAVGGLLLAATVWGGLALLAGPVLACVGVGMACGLFVCGTVLWIGWKLR